MLSGYVYTCIFAVSFTDNFLFQKYGLQLFQPKYPPFVVNNDKTSIPVSYISIDFSPSLIEDIIEIRNALTSTSLVFVDYDSVEFYKWL